MPSSMLFAISNDGKMFGLSTVGKKWRQFPYLGLEFKKISAIPNFLWALGGDRQIYLYVHHFDIPIRIKEEVYENQRWFPIEGFGKRLLPTDRYEWSNEDGTVERRKEKIRLPSMAWQWESDWQLELNLNGQPLNYDGWTYAVDFPTTYYPSKQWSSCVRRRKWFRYRRYEAMYTWCAIPPLHKDPTAEPFVDVCIGGHEKLDENKDMLFVWAVTIYGRVMFRWGVQTICPDGVRWSHVPSPRNAEVKYASCSPTGVLWIVLWDGSAAVRYGITHECPTGEKWLDIPSPEKNVKLIQVSAGLNSVWAISNDNRVWFRKGLRLDCSQISEELCRGSGWVEMVGEMINISLSANDQVFAVSKKDKRIYYRSGIDSVELMGRKWRLIEARTQLSIVGSQSSISTPKCSLSSSSSYDDADGDVLFKTVDDRSSKSAPPCVKFASILLTDRKEQKPAEFKSESDLLSDKIRSWSPIRSGGSLLAMEANPDTDESSLDTEIQKEVFREEDDLSIACELQKTLWSCVCAGAVYINSFNLPKWFVEEPLIEDYNAKQPWRSKILVKLKNRNLLQTQKFVTYESAVETVSWTKSGDFKVLLPASQNLEDCVVELEWIESSATGPDSGILAVFSKKREKSLLQVSLAEIICIMNCSESGQYCFSVHTVKSVESEKSPLMLFLSSENEFHDWFHCISTVSCVINGMSGNPSNHCIWCTTELGDIYMTDIKSLRNNQITENSKYFKEFNVREHNVPFKCQLLNGFPVNSEITIMGRTSKDAESATGDVAFHFNPRFHDHLIVRNSYIDGKWGTEEKEGELFLQTNSDFTLTILCLEQKFKIFLNGLAYTYYEHRLPPENITDVHFGDQVKIFNILYETTEVILHLPELFWRKIEGYLHTVETCISGVTWGLGCNSVPWVYVGKLNSAGVLKTEEDETSVASFEYSTMMDTKDMFVYENQRWNPLTGFTTRGLPTDRSMWSDETGRIKLTKDNVKLPNTRWQWITSWQIDYKTPGGVDRDGWQYAVDFPASYHPFNNITDTVRRRRWVRTCRIIVTKSPWQEVGNTKLKDLSLSTLNASANSATISVWAVTNNGEVLFRHGVSTIRPAGKEWQHVPTDLTIHCVSTSDSLQVWCCAENGISLWRFGITTDNPIGDAWHYVEPAKGCIFQKISVGKWTVWALDKLGDLYVRKEISPLFPEGTHWRRILCDNIKFKHIYASQDHIWAITIEGVVCRRIGVSKDYPEGASWIFGLKGNWLHLSE